MSLADELSELLNISRDSAYRRMRGETVLSLDEVRILSNRYAVSLDALLSPAAETVSFQVKSMNQEDFTLEKWMASISGYLDMLTSFPETDKELLYDSKDLPIFHFFQFPRLAAFKLYFWMKAFSRESRSDSEKYHQNLVRSELTTAGERIWDKYARLPSTEIIRYEMLTVTLRQIEYMHESGMFRDHEEARNLCDDCTTLTSHLQLQAKMGTKVTFGQDHGGAKLVLYLNDLLIGSNTILFKMGSRRITVITPNNFDLLTTSHEPFCQLTESHINNLIDKSVLISMTAEKERNKFFNQMEKMTQELRARLV